MKWRSHLPNECPPEDATPVNGVVYRLANRKKINEKDFLSYREMKPDKHYEGKDECEVCGLSIYTELEGITRLKRRVPATKRKKVMKGTLTPKYGKMKNTPSNMHKSHHTWWVPDDEKPWEVFHIVESPG